MTAGELPTVGSLDPKKPPIASRSERQLDSRTSSNEDIPATFLLEDLYPAAADVFGKYGVNQIETGNALVVLDTNTLLVPYNIKQDDLTALEGIYRKLAQKQRLLIAARTAREFIKNRDIKLAALLKALDDQRSRLQIPQKRLSPLLEGVAGYEALRHAQEALTSARRDYEDQMGRITDILRSWSGDDPITQLYKSIFPAESIVDIEESRADLLEQWLYRLQNRIPPGYKDLSKDDLGIGDFIIWKIILKIGKQHSKDLIFVTGEEKGDWFVRSNNEGIYPRPELIDEYRRSSDGKSLALLSLADFLSKMKVAPSLVEEVRSAETTVIEPDDNVPDSTQPDEPLIPAEEVQSLLHELFPNRRRTPRVMIMRFRRELARFGCRDLNHLRTLILTNMEEAENREYDRHKKEFFTDIGIARECMTVEDANFRQIIIELQKERKAEKA